MPKIDIAYDSSPTLRRFHADSQSFVRGVMGPIGSGKSVGCVMEVFRKCLTQKKVNGKRRSRWAVIRNTYPELKSTTIKTWQEWIHPSLCSITWGAPIEGKMQFNLGKDDRVEAEIYFLALDLPKDVRKLLSLELTGCWVNEARELPKSVIDVITGRVGRFPPKRAGGFDWSGIIMDTNPPDDLHWWYKISEEEPDESWRFFKQPGALMKIGNTYHPNPAAENVENHPLGYTYWTRQLAGKTDDHIKVYMLGEYGTLMEGKPIYAGQWLDSMHVAEGGLNCNQQLPIIAGWDFGLTPAVCLAQITPKGKLNILDEIVGEDVGVKQFADTMVLPYLNSEYAGVPVLHVGDPAGVSRAESNERSAFDELVDLGIDIEPAPTNDAVKRWESVRHFLMLMTDGGPAFRLDPKCKILRKGFNGGYKFRQLQVSGNERYAEKPDKDKHSHIHDALQYVCAHLRKDYLVGKSHQGGTKEAPKAAGWT